MGSSYVTNPIEFLITTVFGLYILAFMLRLLLALLRADFYNPVSQFLVRITNPLIIPVRRVLPSVGKWDTSTITIMLVLQVLAVSLVLLLRGGAISLSAVLVYSAVELLSLGINVFLFAILIQVVISWINPGTYNPVTSVLHSLTEPVLRPIRQVIPPVSGFDLSPLVALIGLQILKMLLLPPLRHLAG
jgi:YggT family protein